MGIILFFISAVLSIFAFSTFYDYRKNSYKVKIDKYKIWIGNRIFFHNEIKEIVLTGKRNLGSAPTESVFLLFNNGTKIILFDKMYSNISEIKQFLEQVVLNKQEEYNPKQINKIRRKVIRFEKEEIFKKNQFISASGILLWSFIAFFILVLLSDERNPPLINSIIAVGGWVTFMFAMFSWQMYYFGLTEKHLIIRNHNYPRMAKIYQLSDIKEVVFEHPYGTRLDCMRVITIDYKTKLYPAQTLRNKTWLKMKRELEKNGVKVRNECVIENVKKIHNDKNASA